MFATRQWKIQTAAHCFFFPYLLRAQNMFRAIEGKIPCDLKGNKN